jgi:hypothetical protein
LSDQQADMLNRAGAGQKVQGGENAYQTTTDNHPGILIHPVILVWSRIIFSPRGSHGEFCSHRHGIAFRWIFCGSGRRVFCPPLEQMTRQRSVNYRWQTTDTAGAAGRPYPFR